MPKSKATNGKGEIKLTRSGDVLVSTFIPPARVSRRLMEYMVPGFAVQETDYSSPGVLRSISYDGRGIGQFNTTQQADQAFIHAHQRVALTTGRVITQDEVVHRAYAERSHIKV